MNKKLLLSAVVALTTLLSVPASAQIKFGIVGGLNVSKLSFSRDVYDSNNRLGWYAGPKLYVKIPLAGLGVDAAAQFSTRRLNSKVETTAGDVGEASRTLSTIEIPVNVRYSVGLASVASLYFATGPQFGFNVGNRHLSDYELRKANVTWNIGAGLRLLNHLEIGAGYNIAVSKFGKYLPYDLSVDQKNSFRSNTWQVQAAYIF